MCAHVCMWLVCVCCLCVSLGDWEGCLFCHQPLEEGMAVIVGKHVRHSSSGSHAAVCMSALRQHLLTLETLLPGLRLPNRPNHMSSSAVIPTSPGLLGVRHRRSTTDISVGMSTACAWLSERRGRTGVLRIFYFRNNRYQNSVEFTSDPDSN